eukprot:1360285-Amphidinium_carterae.3
MPNSSKSSIDRTAGSLISLARKVRSLLSNLSKQGFGRVPLDLKSSFMPSKKLAFTLPTTRVRHPSNPVRQDFQVPDIGPLPLPLLSALSHTLSSRGQVKVPVTSLRCQALMVFRSAATCGSPAGPP